MAREKKLVVGAINIAIQPHTPKKYLDLFSLVYKLRQPVKISGDQYGLLVGMHKLDRVQEAIGPLTGDIFRYTDIDKNAHWFNTTTNDFASEDDVERVRIPDNLKPNSARFSYIFYPDSHIIFYEGYYESKSFGPANAERFFERLLNVEDVVEKFGRVDVTHVPEINALTEALNLPVKERIEMVVKRPNPDDHADAERRVMERMRVKNAAVYKQSYKAVQGQSIEIDEELETMAHISAKNGSFFIKGKDRDSKPVEFSTAQHPLKVTEYYDPAMESAFDLLKRTTVSMISDIVAWYRK